MLQTRRPLKSGIVRGQGSVVSWPTSSSAEGDGRRTMDNGPILVHRGQDHIAGVVEDAAAITAGYDLFTGLTQD